MSSPFSLEHKKILVTGATSGIGDQVVKSIVKMGGKVIISGRNTTQLNQLQNELGDSIPQSIVCDLTQEKEIEALASVIENVDGVVHCAGMVTPYPIRYLSFQKIDETMKLNFYSSVVLVGQLDRKKKLNKKSSLVFISSISSKHPHKGGTAYSAAKSALESFVKVAALEYAQKEIRANCVSPGMVNTPLYKKAAEDASHDTMQAHIDKYPLGIGEPEDVANAIIYLLSDASKWVTGTNIVLDGGVLLGY